jgi:protocatechuate 3,4-dioxygenase beta subunit
MDSDDRQIGRILGRREALALLGSAAASLASLPAIRWTAPLLAAPATLPASAALAQATTPTCVVRPELTEGPYFVDEQLNRSDIRSEPSDGSIKDGLQLALTFNVSQVGATCSPLVGATLDVWQCDALGVYSGVTDAVIGFHTVGLKFLRGYQVTDSSGVARFVTIVPGWYQGRTVHIHFKIRTAAPTGGTYEFTSQLFLDDMLIDQILAQPPYSAKGAQRDTTNANDMHFASGGDQLLLAPSEAAQGLAATFAIGLDLSDTATSGTDRFSMGGGGPGGPGGGPLSEGQLPPGAGLGQEPRPVPVQVPSP